MKKLKLKKKNFICGVLLLIATIDLIYLLINMTCGAMLNAFGIITMIVDVLTIWTTSEELKKEIK